MKKRLHSLLAVVLTVMMLLSAMPFGVLAVEGAEKTVFSLNPVSETDTTFVVSVILEEGEFSALDFGIEHNRAKIKKCTDIETLMVKDFVTMSNTETGLFSGAIPTVWNEEGSVIATYTYEKKSGARITKNDFELVIHSCDANDHTPIATEVVNNLYDANLAFGTCGDNAKWVLYDNGELCVFGTGSMYNYSATDLAPWSDYTSLIRAVRVEGITNVGNDTFVGCENLEKVVLNDSVTKIGNSAFRDCTKLENIDIPASVKSIGHYAFYGCTSLKDIVIPNGVKTIGNHAFRKCSGLKSVVLNHSITAISPNAFEGCSALENAIYNGKREQWELVSVAEGNEALTDKLMFALDSGVCGDGVVWMLIDDDSLVITGNGTMYDFESPEDLPWKQYSADIKTITVKYGVKYIGDNAFKDNPSLEAVYFDGTEYEWSLVEGSGSSQGVEIICLVKHGDENDTITVVSDIPVTCTTPGEKIYYCRCGETFTDVTPALGHSFGDWVTEKEQTCTQDGYKVRKCSGCDAFESITLPALGLVRSVSVSDIKVTYKESGKVVPKITADEGITYTVVYTTSNADVAEVSQDGTVTTKAVGEATITCTVTDQYGNVVTDTCEVKVEYTFWQWLIVIILFGWIWY